MPTLASWSPLRMGCLWLGGLAVQAGLLFAPVALLALLPVQRSFPRESRVQRDSIAVVADSLSVTRQIREIAASPYAALPGADLVMRVLPPSEQRDESDPTSRRVFRTVVTLLVAAYVGVIPLALVAITALWWWRRGRVGRGPLASGAA